MITSLVFLNTIFSLCSQALAAKISITSAQGLLSSISERDGENSLSYIIIYLFIYLFIFFFRQTAALWSDTSRTNPHHRQRRVRAGALLRGLRNADDNCTIDPRLTLVQHNFCTDFLFNRPTQKVLLLAIAASLAAPPHYQALVQSIDYQDIAGEIRHLLQQMVHSGLPSIFPIRLVLRDSFLCGGRFNSCGLRPHNNASIFSADNRPKNDQPLHTSNISEVLLGLGSPCLLLLHG
ncbi:unnamed protein product [Acanthosepion pharaonis]|uniref:Uncharacterized protein n=1 Tax=Acanthosepion pharaonis TaxID=158019 RepID=A0A812DH93_ACAPH|nr:unnamed protein product [Sepia pharaonis]